MPKKEEIIKQSLYEAEFAFEERIIWDEYYHSKSEDIFVKIINRHVTLVTRTAKWIYKHFMYARLIDPPVFVFTPGRIDIIDPSMISGFLGLATAIHNYTPNDEFSPMHYTASYVRAGILEGFSYLDFDLSKLKIPRTPNVGSHRLFQKTADRLEYYIKELLPKEQLILRWNMRGVTYVGDIQKYSEMSEDEIREFTDEFIYKIIDITCDYFQDPIVLEGVFCKGGCPQCGSDNILEIVYGHFAGPIEENIVLGGCVTMPDSPYNHCDKCRFEW